MNGHCAGDAAWHREQKLLEKYKDFCWGEVLNVHTVGDHEIVEYVVDHKWPNAGKVQFHHVSGRYRTFDSALIGAICAKYDDCDDDLYIYVARLIPGLVPEDE